MTPVACKVIERLGRPCNHNVKIVDLFLDYLRRVENCKMLLEVALCLKRMKINEKWQTFECTNSNALLTHLSPQETCIEWGTAK